MTSASLERPEPPTRDYALLALSLLAVINLISYINRSIIFAVFEPIKSALHLTDTQLGWLGSAYVLVFSVAALPFGVMSDLRSRRAVIAVGVALWSAFTFLSGLCQSFWPFFICRAAVGLGGAAYGAASASLVADYFPGSGRALAMGVLAAGIAVGGVIGIGLGGILEPMYGWRVTFMVVAVPGLVLAVLVARLKDPTRVPAKLSIRAHLRDLEMGVSWLWRQCLPLLVGLTVGAIAAYQLDRRFGTDSSLDIAAFGAAAGIGLAFNIYRWVRLNRAAPDPAAPPHPMQSAWEDVLHALRTVLRTPTLVYVFIGGALISFGLNGIVGWAPTFLTRELGLSGAAVSEVLGKYGLIFGTAGTLFGGFLADWLLRFTRTGRVLTVSLGFILGGPLTIWLLTIRDLSLFKPVFCAAFFFLTWYSGPIAAVIFDVAPARIGASVAGAYLMFIHLAGDTIALPLVGLLSEKFGIDRAVILLPCAALAGGLVVLGAIWTLGRDIERTVQATGEWKALTGEPAPGN